MNPIVIIGTGLAGYMLAKEFRKLDQQTPLVIISSGDGSFYSKPQLSTALSMKREPADLATQSAEQMAEQLGAIIHTKTEVKYIDPTLKTITFSEQSLTFDKLILAMGATAVVPPLQGNACDEVLSVNDLEDYHQFREKLKNKKKVVILGAGLVGCEFANDLSNAGFDVSVIAPATYPVDRLIPELVGFELQKALEANGVHWHLGVLPQAVHKSDNHYAVTLDNGISINADIVMSAIGIHPRKALAEDCGLRVNRGVLVNRLLQTSDPNIFALGDCAEVNGMLLFFVAPLLQCARALAQTLAGTKTEVDYPAMPVVLKTPVCPLVVMPPPQDISGDWQFDRDDDGLQASFYDDQKRLRGFVLTHKKIRLRAQLQKEVPPLFE